MTRIIFGADVGGVIMDKANDRTDTSFLGDNFLEATAVPGAIETLRTIRDFVTGLALRQAEKEGRLFDRTDPPIHIVSKCGPKAQRKTRLWMAHHGFFARTGIPENHLHFCLERRDKGPICNDLGITHFVDDKLEVLSYLESVPCRYLFCPSDREIARYRRHLPSVIRMDSWSELLVAFVAANRA